MKSNTPQCYNLADDQRQHFMPPNVQTHNRHCNRNTLIANLMTKTYQILLPSMKVAQSGGKIEVDKRQRK